MATTLGRRDAARIAREYARADVDVRYHALAVTLISNLTGMALRGVEAHLLRQWERWDRVHGH